MDKDQATDSPTDDGDPVPVDIVVGECDTDSKIGQKRRETHRLALNAGEAGDAAAMFAAYRIAVEDRAHVEEMWGRTLRAMMKDPSAAVPSTGPVEAIRDVALAAIKLAADVALNAQENP